MTVVLGAGYGASEAEALAELHREGFSGAAKDYTPGTTEPHTHEQDLQLYIMEGEFRLTEVDEHKVHVCKPGDKVFVAAGTPHSEDHGELRMVVGRRQGAAPVATET